jgi:hypothetical protein
VVCALSFLREHNGGNDGNNGCEGRGAFSMHAAWQEGNNDVEGRRRFRLRGGENRREDQDLACGLHCKHPPSLSTDGNCDWDVRRGRDRCPSQVTHLSPLPLTDARFLYLLTVLSIFLGINIGPDTNTTERGIFFGSVGKC